jgi:hypothetical protein
VGTPYVDEFVRRLRMQVPTVDVDVDVRPSGAATLRWAEPDLAHRLALYVHEKDLAAAVTALGEDCRDALWPGSTIDAAGFNLLLVHLGEIVATRDTTEPLRITSQGLRWPRDFRED